MSNHSDLVLTPDELLFLNSVGTRTRNHSAAPDRRGDWLPERYTTTWEARTTNTGPRYQWRIISSWQPPSFPDRARGSTGFQWPGLCRQSSRHCPYPVPSVSRDSCPVVVDAPGCHPSPIYLSFLNSIPSPDSLVPRSAQANVAMPAIMRNPTIAQPIRALVVMTVLL